ncbi:MAG: TIM44-like domain-containing protein [Alphaproteobacteria bacterium]|nr:TIM44-like domain-containing protein [Alphaproteobacteria bacterium]
MIRRPSRFFAILAAAVIGLAPMLAEARAGGGQSSGSRGARTQQAAPATPTTQQGARPVERTATTPAQAQRPAQQAQAPQQQSWFQRNPFMTGLLGGMLGAGLIGALMGGGFNFGEGLAGFLGFAAQLALFGGIAFLIMRFIRSRREAGTPAAYAGTGMPRVDAGPGPMPNTMARTTETIDVGGPAGGGLGPKGGDEIGLAQGDFEAFERRLVEIQTAWSKGDLNGLKRAATPEMVSYFADDLAANASRGVENRVEDVKLEQGDLAEAWQEGGTQYATVGMRFSARDYTVALADGRVVDGNKDARSEATETWTFMRIQGGDWILSAIQQA